MHSKDTSPQRFLKLHNFELQCGATLPELQVSYWVHGELAPDGANAVLFPTWFASTRAANQWLIGPGMPLDTDRLAVIVVDSIGNGESTSPSNAPAPLAGPAFPSISVFDNVRAQAALLDHLGVQNLRSYVGRSMGAQQAFCFCAVYPERAKTMLALTGSAITSPHNYVFLDGLEAALTCGVQSVGSHSQEKGLSAFGRVFAGWVFSQGFFRREGWREELDAPLPEYLKAKWERHFLRRDVFDLVSLIHTWKNANLAANPVFDGDIARAFAAITAKTIVMPSRTDMYFPVEDSAWAARQIADAKLTVIESDWGHRAGAPGSPAQDIRTVSEAVRELLRG